jgi:hypothetical protein
VVSLMAASESLFVTFGPWLKDEFSVSDTTLALATAFVGSLVVLVGSFIAATWWLSRKELTGGD